MKHTISIILSTLLVTSKTRTLIIVAIIVVSIFQVNGEEYISTILKYLGRGNCPILSIACWKNVCALCLSHGFVI